MASANSPSFARPPRPQQQTDPENRGSMLRASILESALELGIGSSRTVQNWMFNPADGIAEEEEEENQVRPASLMPSIFAKRGYRILDICRVLSLLVLLMRLPQRRKSRISPLDSRSAPSPALGYSSIARVHPHLPLTPPCSTPRATVFHQEAQTQIELCSSTSERRRSLARSLRPPLSNLPC